MKKKSLSYLIIALLVILVLSTIFYFAFYCPWNKDLLKADQGALKLITLDQTLQLNPGERGNVLDAVVLSIDQSKKPTEITATISLFRRFSNPPIPTIIRSILVKDVTTITKGPAQSETEQPIGLSELQDGDNLSVIVAEPVSDALWREYFTAIRIKKIEKE